MALSKIKTNSIADNAITSTKIGVDVIVAEDLASNSITVAEIANEAVTTAKIADANVTSGKLASSITITTLTGTNDATISGLTVGKGGGAVASNTVVGYQAINASATGTNNTAVGYQAAYTTTTGQQNVAVGQGSLYSTTTGSFNAAVGRTSLYFNTTGASNVAIGNAALESNTTGSFNIGLGQSALGVNTTASWNAALGHQAGFSNVTGAYNTFIGTGAGYTSTNGSNTFIGQYAGFYVTTGTSNTFIGPRASTNYGAGELMTTGSNNTIVGGFPGNQGLLDIRTSSNNLVLSDGGGNPRQFTDSTNTTYRWNNTSSFGWSKSITGVKTAGSSGTSNKLVQIGPTCALTVKIMAIQSGGEQNSAQLVGNITVAYGGGGTVAGQSAATQGNITGISIAYDNGGSPIYTINCTLTYSGAAPTIYYVIEGLSTYNFTPL